jgi:ubiquinol-cytochrome c reductase cytochrome b subunit
MSDVDSDREAESLPLRSRGKFFRWLDARADIQTFLHHTLDEPIPGGAKIAYVFGSGLLFLFLSQIITGVFLAMYYVPDAEAAHTTVAYITKEVSGGSFLRGIHAYGSSAVVIVLVLHMLQTFIYGSYKGRRELLWIFGCILAGLMLGMAFTGYLLPWDQKAYFATTVGTNILSEVPLVGNALKRLLRGGNDMGTLTLSRFFVLHVFIIPAMIFAAVAGHIYLFRQAGAAGPIDEDPITPKKPAQSFYPRQVVYDMGFALLILIVLGTLSYFVPIELGPRANPADTQFIPRPEWYYLPMFQYLKYWRGGSTVVGILIIPTILAILIIGLPFFDRRLERRPWKRPYTVGTMALLFAAFAALGIQSRREDARDPGIAAQIKKQNEEMEAFRRAPFEPQSNEASATAAVVAADPTVMKGKEVFAAQGCDACHGDGGVGTAAAPKLIGLATKFDADAIAKMLRKPTPAMESGGMQPIDIGDAELKSLVAYLRSLR